jgi:hypothetical protein
VAGTTQRTLVGIAALLAGFVAVVAVVAVVGSRGGAGVGTSGLTSGAAPANPPPPSRGAVVLAREAGALAVALAVEPGRRRLTASVLSGAGGGANGLRVRFRLGGATVAGRPCGAGCYRATAPPGASLRRVSVLVPGGPAVFRLPASAPPAAAIVRRATRVFRSLRTLVYLESLSSDPTHRVVTTWTMAAPDRLAYRIHGGAQAVVIGGRRWDRTTPADRWIRSSQSPPLLVPQPSWGSQVTNAHLLGNARVAGRPVDVVSFAVPSIPAWFTAWIDRRTSRTLQLRMTAAAHFMFHRYLRFDRPVRITPP